MEDEKILELYWDRSESAILETRKKFGSLLFSVSYQILHDRQEAEECENDTYLIVWENIPPLKPGNFKAYLAKIVRNLSIDRLRKKQTQKRGGTVVTTSYEELDECIPDRAKNQSVNEDELRECLNAFLQGLPKEKRIFFLKRYWFSCSIGDIAKQMGCSEKHVKNSLYQTRKKLKEYLEKEGNGNG